MEISAEDKKKIGIGLGVIAGGILLYFLLRKSPENGGTTDPTNNTGGTGNTIFDAKSIADNLFFHMDGFGTDEEAIISELTNINQSQFGQIFTAFGKRNYNSWTGGDDIGGSPQNLKFWLREELSDYYYDNLLKLKYPSYL